MVQCHSGWPHCLLNADLFAGLFHVYYTGTNPFSPIFLSITPTLSNKPKFILNRELYRIVTVFICMVVLKHLLEFRVFLVKCA